VGSCSGVTTAWAEAQMAKIAMEKNTRVRTFISGPPKLRSKVNENWATILRGLSPGPILAGGKLEHKNFPGRLEAGYFNGVRGEGAQRLALSREQWHTMYAHEICEDGTALKAP
jgi:hypothetical protein